jgi:predicted HicB family RNase H-like nuclease
MDKKFITFPFRMSVELHQLLAMAAFASNKSRNQYLIDIVKSAAEKDALRITII